MKRKIAVLLVLAILLTVLPTVGFAAEESGGNDTIETGITPDSWLYGFDQFLKEMQLFFTFNTVAKAGLLHDISEERLAEAREMIEQNKERYGTVALQAYKAALERAVQVLEKAIVDGKDISEVAEEYGSTLTDRWAIIKWVLERIPEEDREKLNVPLQELLEDLSVTIEVVDIDDEETDETGDNGEGTTDPDEEPAGGDETGSGDDETTNEGEDPTGDEETPGEGENTGEDPAGGDETGSEDEIPDEGYISICSLKKLVTAEILEETIGEKAAKLYIDGVLNSRQILAVYAMALQTEKSFDEVLEVFLANKGLGCTAKALGLKPKDALKGVKAVFKAVKAEIKEEFKAKFTKKDFEADPGTTDGEQADQPGETGGDQTSQDPVDDPGDQDAGKDKDSDGKNIGKDEDDDDDKDDDDKDEDDDKDDKCSRDLKKAKDKVVEKVKEKAKDKANYNKKYKGDDKDDDDDDEDDDKGYKSSKKTGKNEKSQVKSNSANAKAKAEKFMEKVKKMLETCKGKAKGKNKK